MAVIDDIIVTRRGHRLFDEEVWDFGARIQGRLMENISDSALKNRLTQIEKNIQYLDEAPGRREELPPEHGWLSPWFWLRLRHWTLAELAARSITRPPTVYIPLMSALRSEFRGTHGGGDKRQVRISRLPWLLDTLDRGRLRLSPATIYRTIEGDEARTDNEMMKAYQRPSHILTITDSRGQRIEPIGDVTFATSRVASDGETEIPYWLMCFSTDLDPRLFAEFSSAEGDDAVIVIFDLIAFLQRALPHLQRVAPLSEKNLHTVNYYDGYHPASRNLSPVTMKDIRFACQREWRMILDPGGRELLAEGGALSVDIGSIADIAAVYAPDGMRIAGSGPDSFFASPPDNN